MTNRTDLLLTGTARSHLIAATLNQAIEVNRNVRTFAVEALMGLCDSAECEVREWTDHDADGMTTRVAHFEPTETDTDPCGFERRLLVRIEFPVAEGDWDQLVVTAYATRGKWNEARSVSADWRRVD